MDKRIKTEVTGCDDVFIFQKESVIPSSLRNYVDLKDDAIRIRSDLTGQKEISLFVNDKAVYIADSLDKLVRFVHKNIPQNLTTRIKSISHLLHDAVIPAPYTIYNEVFSLAIGNSISIDSNSRDIKVEDDYPYLRSCSRQDSVNSTKTLLNQMSNSLDQGTQDSDPIFMLSSGKDSVSLAITCGEIGLKCKTITYKSKQNDNESEVAKIVARKFGLDHEVVTLDDTNLISQEEKIVDFFRQSIHPCLDFSQLGYLRLLMQLGATGCTIIDGTGNDSYFGGAPCKTDYTKYRLTIGNHNLADQIKKIIRHSNKISYLLRSDAEINFATRTFRYNDTEKWFSNAFNTSIYWRNKYSFRNRKDKQSLETYYIDLEAKIRGRDYDRSCSFLKARLASSFTKNQMFYPYCDSQLIDYCFNLPEKFRFNTKKYINKILLRTLLNEKVQYDSLANKKFGFDFEGRNFIRLHESFVKREILSCSLWDQEKMKVFLRHSLSLLEKNYYESHGILLLFLLSGWFNHNKFLNTRNISL